MIRRHSLSFLVALTALLLFAGSFAFAQTKKQPRRARTAAAGAQTRAKAQKASNLGFGVPESMSGTIQMVVADQNLLIVSGPNKVPYDLKVTPKTVIVVGDKRGTLESLSGLVGKSVSVGFVPQRDGNFATRVEVAG